MPWSEEEHRLFLQGLEIYGKGDWRSISRKCVLTRNPTQARAAAGFRVCRARRMISTRASSRAHPQPHAGADGQRVYNAYRHGSRDMQRGCKYLLTRNSTRARV